MGIFQSDLTIKTAIELGLEDMRENPWLLEDALSDCIQNPYLVDKYGQKQIDAAKEWFANNRVEIYMSQRNDKDKFPCINISLGNSSEKEDMKTMADQSTESVVLLPQQINKPIPFIVKPFDLISYDSGTGEVEVDKTIKGMTSVSPGMILVDPKTGNGYVIEEITPDAIVIEEDLDLTGIAQLAVVPKNQFYTARREHSFFQETYQIDCNAHGDPQTLLWLWTVVIYSILRYREGMLEAQGFTQSTVASSAMSPNSFYTTAGGEVVWNRTITLSGMVENSWIKSPRRIIETVALRTKSPNGFKGGIQILSNSEPDSEEGQESVNWYPINESEEE